MKKTSFFILQLSLVFLSCGKADSLDERSSKKLHRWQDLNNENFHDFFSQFEQKIRNSPCLKNSLDPTCTRITKIFRPATPSISSQNKRILILDSERQPSYRSSFFYYRNKILQFLKIENDTFKFTPLKPIITAPFVLDELFQHETFNSFIDFCFGDFFNNENGYRGKKKRMGTW